ncbi:MAG: GNAT family N-acetyltransferase [Parafilimonas sp.]
METITVRYAALEDANLIAELSRKTFYDSFAAYNTKEDMDKFMNEIFAQENLVAEVGAQGNIFLLAFCNDDAAGYVRMRESEIPKVLNTAEAIEIARIYAVENAIGKGIGSALMEKCIDVALEMNKEIIWLGVWEKNQRAIDFYTRWGFEKFGEHEFILGNDVQTDWLMKKYL